MLYDNLVPNVNSNSLESMKIGCGSWSRWFMRNLKLACHGDLRIKSQRGPWGIIFITSESSQRYISWVDLPSWLTWSFRRWVLQNWELSEIVNESHPIQQAVHAELKKSGFSSICDGIQMKMALVGEVQRPQELQLQRMLWTMLNYHTSASRTQSSDGTEHT